MIDRKIQSKEDLKDTERQIIKDSHPDQGGTTEQFKHARNELDQVREYVENGETIRLSYDSEAGVSYTRNPEQHSSSTRNLETLAEEAMEEGVEGTDYEITGTELNATGFHAEISEQGTTYTATVRAASNTEGDKRSYDVEAEYSGPGGGHRFKNTSVTWDQARSELNRADEENIDRETAIHTTAKMAELSIQWATEQWPQYER